MSTVPQKADLRHPYDQIRQQSAPIGIRCPHCGEGKNIFFSSAQLRRPVYKRLLYCYLRCHSCTHRFHCMRLVPLLFWGAAAAALLLAAAIS
jgi:hypothetical protein